jgi:hypothetical protein
LQPISFSARFRLQQAANTVERALDALNFFLADVRDGLGPYLAIDAVTALRTGNRAFPRVL